jgi:putative peptide zinc metalloprotease protein
MEKVPQLREGIEISPLYTAAQDPKFLVRNGESQQFQVSSSLHRILALIDGKRTLSEIAEAYARETGRPFTGSEIEKLIGEYLVPNGLVALTGMEYSAPRTKSYMSIRIPIFSQAVVRPFTRVLQYLFWPPLMIGGILMAGISEFFFFSQGMAISFDNLTVSNLLALYALFMLSTLFHELGHSSACHRYGARHGAIGFGVYWIFPVLYADVSDVWRLRRRERVVVDFGGIYFQLLTLPAIVVAFLISRNPLWMYLIYGINLSILTSLNPLFRFDGYWMVCDFIGVPNLRRRSQESYRSLLSWLKKTPGSEVESTPMFSPKVRMFLYVYALISNAFFVVFLFLLLPAVTNLIGSYPQSLRVFVSDLPVMFSNHDWGGLISSLGRMVSKSFFLVAVLWGVGRVSLRAIGRIRKGISHAR